MADPVGWLPPVRSEEWDWEPGGKYHHRLEEETEERDPEDSSARPAFDPRSWDGGL